MKSVLVTAIGSFSSDIVIKTLKKLNYYVIGCDINQKELIVDSNNVDFFYQVPKVSDREEYTKKIMEICNKHKVDYIIPLLDIEVDFFNENKSLFDKQLICIPPSDSLLLCRDKYKFQQFIKELDYVNGIDTDFVYNVDADSLRYPVVCKTIDGRSSEGLKVFDKKEEYVAFSKLCDDNYIVENFIDGNIVTVDVVRDNNNNVVSISREELIRTVNGAGLSVYVFYDEELESICNKLASDLGIIGCVNFEFIKTKEGKYYIIECNPRFSGGIEFSCMAGYDFVGNYLKCFTSIIDNLMPYKNQYIARKYEEYIMKIED